MLREVDSKLEIGIQLDKMEFPKSFWVLLLVFLYLVALVIAADLNEVKKNAIKKLDTQVDDIKKLTEKTSAEVEKREGNIKYITKHIREFGDGIIENTHAEVKRTAKSAYIIANLMESPNDVFRCIEYREREALDDSDKYYSQKFLDPGRDFELRAEEYQRNLIKSWKDDYYKAISQYANIYKNSVSDIQRATSESAISSVVMNFGRITKEMADIITVILPNMAKTHIQVIRTLDQLVKTFKQYAVHRVEETSKAIEKCFPKSYQQKFLFGPELF